MRRCKNHGTKLETAQEFCGMCEDEANEKGVPYCFIDEGEE